MGANTKKKDLEIGIQGFETYMQVVTKQWGTNISSSSIHLADYTQFFSRQEFKTWLSASESVSSFEDVPEAVGGEVDVHHVPTRFNPKKKNFTIFRTDKILWLTGPQGNGTGHISNYLKKGLAARSARDTRIIMEFTCASCSEPVSSAFCRQFYKEVVYRNSHPPYNIEPITLNIDILAESIHEYSRDQLSRLELTIFIEGLESVNRQKERKEFLTSVLNLFQRMVKGKSLFKAARMLLISRYDLGIEMTIENSGVEVTPMIFAQERTGALIHTRL